MALLPNMQQLETGSLQPNYQPLEERPAGASDQDWQQYTDAVAEQRQRRADGDLGRYVGTGEGSNGYNQFQPDQKAGLQMLPGTGQINPRQPRFHSMAPNPIAPPMAPNPIDPPKFFTGGDNGFNNFEGFNTDFSSLGGVGGTGGVIEDLTSLGELAQRGQTELNSALYGGGLNLYAGGSVGRQMAGGGSTYYNTQERSRPPMGGLSQLMEMQGRRGDSELVHMNPVEVRMLEAMSPDGRLSINPETGLQEAFKLRDIAAFALPIVAGIAAPYLLPAIGLTGLSGVAAGAIGAGVGGFGAGLLQKKSFGDSLIQGGISGLFSYGLGSMMSPGTMTGPTGAAGGGADVANISGYETGSGLIGASTPVPTQPTSELAGAFGMQPEGVGVFDATSNVFQPTAADAGIGTSLMNRISTSPLPLPAGGLGSTQVPTYGTTLASGIGSLAGPMLDEPEYGPPFELADDAYGYYDADLEGGRGRGRANARELNQPPGGLTGADYRRLAMQPGGFGNFYAAEGGTVPKPYGDAYGPGDPYGGVETETTAPAGTSNAPAGTSMSGLTDPIASIGPFSIDGLGLGLTTLGLAVPALGPLSMAISLGRGLASMIGPPETNALGQTQAYGWGNQSIDAFGNPVGSLSNIAHEMNVDNKGFDAVDDVEGMMSDAVQGFANAHAGEVGDAGAAAAASAGMGGIDGSEEGAAGGFADGGMIDFYEQGGIASLAYGGSTAPTGYANQAFEGMVPGTGTGMSDDVPFSIEGKQAALLSRDEYVLPADIVSQLGDGSSNAGSGMLDNFVSQVRQTKYGNTEQPPANGGGLMDGLMRQGGVV